MEYFTPYSGNNMRGANTTISLHWNVVPNAGLLPNVRGEKHVSTVLPSDYSY